MLNLAVLIKEYKFEASTEIDFLFKVSTTSDVSNVDGCDDFREKRNVMELALNGKGKRSHCKVIIDDGSIDVLAYEMSVDILNSSLSSSSTHTSPTSSCQVSCQATSSDYISPGLMFNVQETGRSSNDDEQTSSTLSPQSYDFVFLRFVIRILS